MDSFTFLLFMCFVGSGSFLAWTYTPWGKRWLKSLGE